MEYTTLGRTGLRASVMGLGCGGPSKLGRRSNRSFAESVAVVRAAFDHGVNLFDTAEAYETETIVGEALRHMPRDRVILSTKISTAVTCPPPRPEEVARHLEDSLLRLRTDYVDIYHLHGVRPGIYREARELLVPALFKLREQGKIRFVGITEAFELDPRHGMLREALTDHCWDVVMTGFNLLNQTARDTVFPLAREQDAGTLIMFAVRRALSRPERLHTVMEDLQRRGVIDSGPGPDRLLGFLTEKGVASSVTEAAYRFCRHEPGAHVVLSGTGDMQHLEENVHSLNLPPLPQAVQEMLREIFRRVDDVVGN